VILKLKEKKKNKTGKLERGCTISSASTYD
jgi:hypothetical protein